VSSIQIVRCTRAFPSDTMQGPTGCDGLADLSEQGAGIRSHHAPDDVTTKATLRTNVSPGSTAKVFLASKCFILSPDRKPACRHTRTRHRAALTSKTCFIASRAAALPSG